MKVQILIDGEVVSTQLISVEALGAAPPSHDLKRTALKKAIEDRAITISQSLRASFRLFDVSGKPLDD